MALYFFLAMSAVSIVKSVQNALYLGRVGFDWKLPLLYLLLAVVSMAVVALMGRLADRYSRVALNVSTLLVLTFCVFIFLLLLDTEAPIAYPLFYVFGGVFSVLVPTQGVKRRWSGRCRRSVLPATLSTWPAWYWFPPVWVL